MNCEVTRNFMQAVQKCSKLYPQLPPMGQIGVVNHRFCGFIFISFIIAFTALKCSGK